MKQTFLSLCLICVAATSFGQRPPAEPMAGADANVGRPVSRQGPEKIETIRRGNIQLDGTLQAAVFSSTGRRAVSTPQLSSLTRDLSPYDKVHIVMPTAYSVSSGEGTFIHNENIDYVWEVLETGAGALMAVPVPLVESLGRSPLPCPCAGINGRCSYLQFCFETLPYIKCTMKPMQAEDPKLCLTLRSTERSVPEINFASSYVVMKNGMEMTVTVFGKASGLWEQKRAWASVYHEGMGCFLEDIHDIGPADLEGSRAQLHNLMEGQVLESPFEFGIKEKGIK